MASRGIRQSGGVNWVQYAIGAALALAAADVMVKLAAGRVPNSLAMLLYGTVPFIVGVIWCVADRQRLSSFAPQGLGFWAAIGVGVMFTLVTVCMYMAFRAAAPISLASPLIRLGGLLVASAVGVLLWKEPVTARYAAGLLLSGAGLYLMMTR